MSKQSKRPSQQKATKKYFDKTYERLSIFVKKGRKDELVRLAEEYGFEHKGKPSVNRLVNYCIDQFVKNPQKADDKIVDSDGE